ELTLIPEDIDAFEYLINDIRYWLPSIYTDTRADNSSNSFQSSSEIIFDFRSSSSLQIAYQDS
ncbi:10446_t:CDS:2, partial [Ambispora leptoticha]